MTLGKMKPKDTMLTASLRTKTHLLFRGHLLEGQLPEDKRQRANRAPREQAARPSAAPSVRRLGGRWLTRPDTRGPFFPVQRDVLLSQSKRQCPQCTDPLERVSRRFIDRLASVWRPVHRYQCRNPLCYWQGNCNAEGGSWNGLRPIVIRWTLLLKKHAQLLYRRRREILEGARSWLRRRGS
jgi:hypothetical protein